MDSVIVNRTEIIRGSKDEIQSLKEAFLNGQNVKESKRVGGVVLMQEDLDDFQRVDRNCGDDQHEVFSLAVCFLVMLADQDGASHHHDHQKGYEGQMLPRISTFCGALIATDTEKFFNHMKS